MKGKLIPRGIYPDLDALRDHQQMICIENAETIDADGHLIEIPLKCDTCDHKVICRPELIDKGHIK